MDFEQSQKFIMKVGDEGGGKTISLKKDRKDSHMKSTP